MAERVALGEPLGELTEHVASCTSCKRIVALPARIAAATMSGRPRSARPDPGLGFSARMTIGAQHQLVVRRRRRVVTGAVGGVAAVAVAVFALTRSPSPAPTEQKAAVETPRQLVIETPVAVEDSELAGMVRLADTKRAMKASAPWGRIRKPLAPYIQLVKGVAP